MYSYVLLYYEVFGNLYQEALDLHVTRYLNEDGTYLFDRVPEGNSCISIDPNPPRKDWML